MRNLLLSAAACGLLVATAASAQTFAYQTLDNPGDPTFNQLLGINDSGTIVGYYGSGAAGHPNIGYEIAAPYTTFLADMEPGSVQTQATGINNLGQTTGFWSNTNTGTDANFAFARLPLGHGYAYISAVDPMVASSPPISQALGINGHEVIVGFYNDANGVSHGYTYSLPNSAYTTITIGGAASDAVTGINDRGALSGLLTTKSGKTLGFVKMTAGSKPITFAVPGSNVTQLLGINNAGIAVGFYLDSSNIPHGVYYNAITGAYSPVNDPAGAMGTALNGINNNNQLVGFYTDAAGLTHGMLVTVTP